MRPMISCLRACAITTGLVAIGSTALAAAPAPVGKRAMLSMYVQVDGAGGRTVKSDGVDVKWSTARKFDVSVELIAQKAEKMSLANIKDNPAAGYKPSAGMQSLQKEAEKCAPDDQACQMAIAMQMMETDDAQNLMQQAAAL